VNAVRGRHDLLGLFHGGTACRSEAFPNRWLARQDKAEHTGVQRLFMQIIVRDNNVDQALRALKKKLQREGVYREMKLRRHYEKPSEKRARERAAAIRRARKLDRKRLEREGVRA
jgi:small subunit ribosomal protein S21